MNKPLWIFALPAAFVLGIGASSVPAQEGAPAAPDDQAARKERGYAIGYFLGLQRGSALHKYVDPEQAGAGFADALRGKARLSDEAMEDRVFELQLAMIKGEVPAAQQEVELRKANLRRDKQLKARKKRAPGKAFLEANAKKEGVKTTASGLQYKVIKPGTGASPTRASKVTVHYEGRLITGEVFDSSLKRGTPATFSLGSVIPGWTEGLQLMKEGAEFEFYVPENLGYGPRGSPPKIAPYSALVFRVTLIKVGS